MMDLIEQLKILEDELAIAIEFAKELNPQVLQKIKQLKQELEQQTS